MPVIHRFSTAAATAAARDSKMSPAVGDRLCIFVPKRDCGTLPLFGSVFVIKDMAILICIESRIVSV
jgi:D-serine deaminase-like pyridoxal phosphate-dependent protein